MRTASSLPVLLLASTAPVWGLAQPVAVSPGAADRPLLAVSGCPTFSWGTVPGHAGLQLTVHAFSDDGGLAALPAFHVDLPAGAASWTPPADHCLAPGKYAWVVQALGDMRADAPEPLLFGVPSGDRVRAPKQINDAKDETEIQAGGPEAITPVELVETASDPARLRPVAAPAITPCGGFNDVEATDPFCTFIQQAFAEDLVAQCSTGLFCPGDSVTRRQMARLLLAARQGSAGGVLTGSYPAPGIAAAFRLPQDCPEGDVVGWSDTEWVCF